MRIARRGPKGLQTETNVTHECGRQWLSEIGVGTEPIQTRAHTRSMQQCRQGCICMI